MAQLSNLPDTESLIDPADACAILQLRLLIARAANKDSLHWWEDDSFSEPAQFIFNRTFPGVPRLAVRSLALRTAVARHRDACDPHTLHLYRLDADNLDRLILEFWPLLEIPVPQTPITTLDALRQQLISLTGGPMPYTVVRSSQNGGLQIRVPQPSPNKLPMLHRAQTFAWAFLEGTPGQPVIPYSLE